MSQYTDADKQVMTELFDAIFIASHLVGEVLHFLPLCHEHRVVTLAVMGSFNIEHITLTDQAHCITCQRKANYGKLTQESYASLEIQQDPIEANQEVFPFSRKIEGQHS